MNSFFPIFYRYAGKRHIVKIALAIFIYLSSGATVKAEPCFSEGFPFSSGQMVFELSCGLFEVVNSIPKIMVNVVRPIHGGLIDFFEFFVESVGKIFCGTIKNVSIPQFSGEAQLDKYKNQRTTNAKQQEIRSGDSDTEDYHFLWYLLPMYIVALSSSYRYTQQQTHRRPLFGVLCSDWFVASDLKPGFHSSHFINNCLE